jgi:hypothetical protein
MDNSDDDAKQEVGARFSGTGPTTTVRDRPCDAGLMPTVRRGHADILDIILWSAKTSGTRAVTDLQELTACQEVATRPNGLATGVSVSAKGWADTAVTSVVRGKDEASENVVGAAAP